MPFGCAALEPDFSLLCRIYRSMNGARCARDFRYSLRFAFSSDTLIIKQSFEKARKKRLKLWFLQVRKWCEPSVCRPRLFGSQNLNNFQIGNCRSFISRYVFCPALLLTSTRRFIIEEKAFCSLSFSRIPLRTSKRDHLSDDN